MDEEQDSLVAKADEMFCGGVCTGDVVDDYLRDRGIGVVAEQDERQLSFAKCFANLLRQRLENHSSVDLTAEDDFFPRTGLIDGREYKMVTGLLQRSYEAIHDLGVHAFENPGIIRVEQTYAVRAAARKRAGTEISTVAHFTGDPPYPLGGFDASAMRFLDIAPQDPGDC
jgi:hypothetical protein